MNIKYCPKCGDIELAMSIQEINGSFRPLKWPHLRCPNPSCRRIVNTVTGLVYKRNKLEPTGVEG